MDKYLKRKKIFLNKSEQQSDNLTEEGDALPSSPTPPPISAPAPADKQKTNSAKKVKAEAPSKKKPAQVRKSSRRSRSSMDLGAEEELLMDTPEVGLTEELIPDMPEMKLEENVIEESYEIPHDATDYIVPAIIEEEPVKKKATPKTSHVAAEEEDLVSPKLEVTGVSRSGRVRKKSSKLTDFKSPDEIDPRYKRKNAADNDGPSTSTPKSRRPAKKAPPPVEELFVPKEEIVEEEEEISFQADIPMDFDSDTDIHHTEEVAEDDEHLSDESGDGGTQEEMDDDEIDDDDDDEGQFIVDESPARPKQGNQATSLYMMEKSRKKMVVKDGKVVGRQKAQRKDKGKTRYTAYMLWAKQARKDALKFDPDMDFSTTSKKLGEMWGLVPNGEKILWRRKAKRMSAKQKLEENKAFAQGQQRKLKNTAPPSPPKVTPVKAKIDRRGGQGPLGTLAAAAAVAQQQQLTQQQQLQNVLAAVASEVSKSPVKSSPGDPQSVVMFKAVTTTPVDVAAHLKLLGESLSNIGERLKEHEGQIAVSGSVSVLLDSLICAMGPLICLTQQVPEYNVLSQEQLSQTLDNIAYIMPGL